MQHRLTVIFDFDGTLANTIDLITRIYNVNAEKFGARQVNTSEFPALRKLGYKKAMKDVGVRWAVLPKLILFISREMKAHMNEVKPYPGIADMLRKLQSENISIGVLTSNNYELVQDFFETNKFPVFDFIVSEKTIFGKDKAIKRIIKRHGLQRDHVVYVGDEPRDVTASNKAKIKIIGVTWGLGGRESFEKHPPTFQVDDAAQLFETILDIAKN